MHQYCIIAQSFQWSMRESFLAGAIVLAILVIWLARSRATRSQGAPRQIRNDIEPANQRTEQIHQELDSLLTELENASGRITSRIESEFARLGKSIEEADRRISALRILLEAARQAEASRQTPEKLSPPRPEVKSFQLPSVTLSDMRSERIYALADQGLSYSEIARRLGETPGEIELILNLRAARP